jgi:hypothetical protein
MKHLIKAIILVLLAGPTIATAETVADAEPEAITLTDQGEIKSAIELSDSIDELSKKVMACNNESTGSASDCDCYDLDTCKFKKEYMKAANSYCKVKKTYPSWTGKTVNFDIEANKNTHSLYMGGLEQQFGRACKK